MKNKIVKLPSNTIKGFVWTGFIKAQNSKTTGFHISAFDGKKWNLYDLDIRGKKIKCKCKSPL